MRPTPASTRWIPFGLAFTLALGLAVLSSAADQDTILTNGRNLQIPINHGLPDRLLGFTPLPAAFFVALLLMIATYLGLVELGKAVFYQHAFAGVNSPVQHRRLHRAVGRFRSRGSR